MGDETAAGSWMGLQICLFLCACVCDDVVVVYRSVIDSKSGAIYFDGFFSGGWGINGTQNE